MMNLEGDGWDTLPLLKRRIVAETGLDCSQFKEKYLKRRIAVRMRAWGVEDCAAYSRILSTEVSEREMLLKDITINVTYFFRDPKVFNMIEKEILPKIIYSKVKQKSRVVSLWSAGCASGEEPYSLGIVLHSLLGTKLPDFVVTVLGTDIDAFSLEVAKNGVYASNEVENVPPKYLRRYFTSDGNKYSVTDDIRSLVRFRHLDLFSDYRRSHFDIIFCRNVIIYFSREMQNKLFSHFYESLRSGGYLVLGKTEMLTGDAKDLFGVIDARERIYQKDI
jgi:chemotaxis protein methyltransferase CheR